MVRQTFFSLIVLVVAATKPLTPAMAQDAPRHGISIFGDLKYGPDFTHFDYVNPAAPKGGRARLAGVDSFDTLNPFTLKGVPAHGAGLVFDTLMTRALDEPDALYGLLAETIRVAPDRSWVEFKLHPKAQWHDGKPVTARDVLFTFQTLRRRGHPVFKVIYDGVERAVAPTLDRIRFILKPLAHRNLPVQLAGMPVISRAYFLHHRFEETTLEPPLGSGPYKIAELEPGRSVAYKRVKNYWGRDLPVNRGRFNFDTIEFEYYRDRGLALEAFFAGEYDFREEFSSVSWARRYDRPQVRDGLVVKEAIPDGSPVGVQAFFINLRRDRFKDRRVREAINLAFDFRWTNKTLFYGIYKRIDSVYENTPFAAHQKPSPEELALLEPLRDKVPKEVFDTPYVAPRAGRGRSVRANLLKARDLLAKAGWTIRNGRLEDKSGTPFRIEFLLAQASFKRIVLPFVRNLNRLGFESNVRIVDTANFIHRRDTHDFDLIMEKLAQYPTPGDEQSAYFSSEVADTRGTRNLSGIQDEAVDTLLGEISEARTRQELITATRALDRVLMWNYYIVPHWYKGTYNVAYWNRFGRPATVPTYDLGMISTWWFDQAKSAAIDAGEAPPQRPRRTRPSP